MPQAPTRATYAERRPGVGGHDCLVLLRQGTEVVNYGSIFDRKTTLIASRQRMKADDGKRQVRRVEVAWHGLQANGGQEQSRFQFVPVQASD